MVGGSKFGLDVDTATLRDSECTSIRIKEDKSAYWIPVGSSTVIRRTKLINNLRICTSNGPTNLSLVSAVALLCEADKYFYLFPALTRLQLLFVRRERRCYSLP